MAESIVHEWVDIEMVLRAVNPFGDCMVRAAFYRGRCTCGHVTSWEQTVQLVLNRLKRHTLNGQTSLVV